MQKKCCYCDKTFGTESQLISHQRAVHFKCPVCKRTRPDLRALKDHMATTHKQNLEKVPNSIDGRAAPVVGSYVANDATMYAALNYQKTMNNIVYEQVNAFLATQQAEQQPTIITARGVVSSKEIQKEKRKVELKNPELDAKLYANAMRKSKSILDECVKRIEKERREKEPSEKSCFFTPVDGMTWQQMRLQQLARSDK